MYNELRGRDGVPVRRGWSGHHVLGGGAPGRRGQSGRHVLGGGVLGKQGRQAGEAGQAIMCNHPPGTHPVHVL